MSAKCQKRTSWVAHAAYDLACLLAKHKCAQSPGHGETGEENVGVILVGDDLRREGIPSVLIAGNESYRRCYGEVIENLNAAFVRELRSSCGQLCYVVFQVAAEFVVIKSHAKAVISPGVEQAMCK